MNSFESFSCCDELSGKAAMPITIPAAIKQTEMIDQITPQHCDDPPYRFANWLASELLTFRRIRSSHMSQTLYRELMTPINKTRKRRGSACAMNQNPMSRATATKMVPIVSQSFLPHQRVSRKQTPSTMLATLLATMSNPQKVRTMPMSEEPR